MWEKIVDAFLTIPWWELLLIFCSRIIEVSMGTLRIILINKGYRKQGVILAFFEVTIWVFVASRVIGGISEQPIKGIIYSLGFATGVFVGSKIENYLAFGKVLIQTITSADKGSKLAEELRSNGYGVTTIQAKGKDTERTVLMIYTNRKGKEQLIKLIHDIDETAMIISNDVTTLQGGYISATRGFIK
ncbi:MAG: DUF5698 domain-containing protein [Bacilli bacterium]|jgi:uncharacterized protein YebE (UPF0316 family)|nr:DUF5698 domain-containing protein [Bacilli bacterium]HHU24710.1 DUF2179 domain-containing protein [Acholeplasmataceae bacterium]